MFLFSQSTNPAVRNHIDSRLAFFADLSKSLSGSFQSVCNANLKLSQAMIEEAMLFSQRVLTTKDASDVFGSVASGAQPTSEKLRAYQQHLSRLAADAQIELTRVTQHHAPERSRTAHALADEVTRVAAEASEHHMRQHEETLKNFRDPFQREGTQRGNGSAQAKAAPQSVREGAGVSIQFEGEHEGKAATVQLDGTPEAVGASMQFDSLADNGAVYGKVQGPVAQPAQQAGDKNPRKPS